MVGMTTGGRIDWDALCANPQVMALIDLSIEEDFGRGDVTTESLLAEVDSSSRARIVSRVDCVACGLPLVWKVFQRYDPEARFLHWVPEGDSVAAGKVLCELIGRTQAILSGERVALNFLMRLCGVAAASRQAVERIPPECETKIYDTRKTTPGWRMLEKAAVRTGGAENHRMGLFDAVLIKDNHLLAAQSVEDAVRKVREKCGGLPVEIEVDNLEQLQAALGAKPDIILLDNFDLEALRQAVARTDGRAMLEASGGITLDNIEAVARTGVDRISVGYITHSAKLVDVSLELLQD